MPTPEPCVYRFVPEIGELARWCDAFIIAAAGGEKSRGVVDADVIRAIGEHGVLVNVARGSIVIEAALLDALSSGQLGGAGLEFAEEPHVPQALLELDNVVLQPHRASATVQPQLAIGQLPVTNLDAHFPAKR